MDWGLLLLLTIMTVGFLGYGLSARGRFYEYPFLAGAMFFSFVLPQVPGLANSHFISEVALCKTLVVSCLCLAMCGIGWAVGMRTSGPRDVLFSERRLLQCAAILSILGAYFFYKFSQLPDEERLRGQLTGTSVAYLFFAKLLTYGLALSIICYVTRPSKWALYIILFGLAFYLHRIIIAGRRGETAELLLMFALAFWFQRRWSVPRPFVMAGLAVCIVALLGAADYRQATLYSEKPDWSAVFDIDISSKWDNLLKEGGPEMRNAVNAIEWIDQTKSFNFGLTHWNWIVFNYVPAQLVGYSFKYSLVVDLPDVFRRGYDPGTGETWTGMVDSFASFWYFGCLTFFLLAFSMGVMYSASLRGNTVLQVLYILSTLPSMLAITHFTSEIIIEWVHIFVFLTPVYFYARYRAPPQEAYDYRAAGAAWT